MSYCEYAMTDPLHRAYHHLEYGFPLSTDAAFFERLMLEINQAGLSWSTILRKRDAFRQAYDGFDIDKVAAYGDADVERLLADAGIIRNGKKIAAAVRNAHQIVALRPEYGSFHGWLDAHHPLDLPAWIKLFRSTFVFTGPEVVREFLVSTGYLKGAHDPTCPAYAEIARLDPPWARPAR